MVTSRTQCAKCFSSIAKIRRKYYSKQACCQFRFFCYFAGNYLDRMVSENNSDPQLGSKSERSLHSCLVCSSAQYAFFICSFLHFVCGSISFLHFWKNAPPDFSSFIVESNESCAVKSARLMSKGCDLLELSNFWDGHGTLTFSHAVTVDEFVVEFLQCENIPSVKILGSANNWVTNYTIVSTASHSGGLTQRWHRAPGKTRISLHPHQPWPWILDHLLHHLLLCLCFLSLGACGAAGRSALAKDAAACFSVGLALLNGASAAGYAALRRWQETPLPALACAAYALFSAAVDFHPPRSAKCCILLGAAWLGASLCYASPRSAQRLLLVPPLPAAAMVALDASFLIRRRRQRCSVMAAAERDRARFDAAWRQIAVTRRPSLPCWRRPSRRPPTPARRSPRGTAAALLAFRRC